MSDTEIDLIPNPVVHQRGNSLVQWLPAPGRWYWELRLDDQEHGEAIAGVQWTYRKALRVLRRAARKTGTA